MKIKTKLMALIATLSLASCALGPTAKMADGTVVTLGGDALVESTGDARQAVLPNGLNLSWVRKSTNQTGVAKYAASAYMLGKTVDGALKTVQSNNAAKIAKSKDAVKINQANVTGAVDQAVVGKAGPTANVTGPNTAVINTQ